LKVNFLKNLLDTTFARSLIVNSATAFPFTFQIKSKKEKRTN
jgi:hypothetical protein